MNSNKLINVDNVNIKTELDFLNLVINKSNPNKIQNDTSNFSNEYGIRSPISGNRIINNNSIKNQQCDLSHNNLNKPCKENFDFKYSLRKSSNPQNINGSSNNYNSHSKVNLDQFKAINNPYTKIENLFTLSSNHYENEAKYNVHYKDKTLNFNNYNSKTTNNPYIENETNKQSIKILNSKSTTKSTTIGPIFENSTNDFDEKCYYQNRCISVKEFSYREDPNIKYRQSMEDFCKIIDKYNEDPKQGYFSLFDGHGGAEIAKYCKDRTPEILLQNLKSGNFEKALLTTFEQVDSELKKLNSENIGSTACIVLITYESKINKKVVYSANVGDTRCIIINKNSFKRLSLDHRCENTNEKKRIKEAGGVIFNNRVYGQLMLTRSFGDNSLKKHGVISVPYITRHVLDENDTYLVIASDGIWDVLDDEFIYRLSKTIENSDEYCKQILKLAITSGSKDNTSCIVVKI